MRKLSPILFLVLVITSWNKISAQALSVVDLLSNSTQSLTSDASYFYFDSYLNLCLGQIQLCNEGFTVVFNLSLMFNAQENTESITYDSSYLNGRRVLASSGGDSRFTSGGFYLHQIDIRGDNHLELAVRSFDKLYIQNIYFEGKSDNYLACVWNKKSLTTYIDGSLYSTTSEPVELPFTSLNFNPIKNFKTLITRPQSSAVYQARFTDQVLSSTNELIKGTGKSTSSLQTPNRVPVGIKVNLRSLKPEYLEVNQPIGFEITFLNTMSTNFLTYVSVDNQELEVLIGKNFTFTEFDVAGRKKLNFTSVSLNYPKLTITEEFYIDVNPKLTSEPLYSLQLLVANVEASTKVTVSLSVSGGAPYTCFVNFGDKTNTSVESFVDRLTNKDFTHEYSSTGIFNVSATCSSGQVKESILTDSQIVYVRINSRQTDYENFNQVFLERINSESVELVLPFQACTEGIVLQVIDQSIQTVIENWICSDSQPVSKDGYMIVNLKLSQLTETYENYVSIRFTEFIQIASYLISWQEKIVQPPKIKILTENLQLDQPVDFEVTVDIYADSMIRIDFGDLDDNIILYQINGDVAEDQRLRVFSLRHVYKNRDDGSKIQKFSFNVQQANYMNLQSANVELTFELALSGFELSTSKNKLDEVNQEPIVFKIVPTTTDQPVKVSEIKLLFNDLEPTKFRLIKNFTFDQSNNFQLLINHTYTNYGIFQAVVNCSNSISSQIIKIKITVGKQLNSIDGYITNSYASIKSDITFFINISGGNGYNINLDLKNGKSIFVEWSQIRTRINSTAVKFTRPEGILITGSYDLVGTYSPEVNVTNPFGSLLLKFCSHIKVVAKSLNKLMSIQYQESCTLKSNLALLKNSIVVGMLGDRIEMGKGVTNSFSIGYTDCVSTENSLDSELAMYWHLRLLDQNSNQFNIPDGCMKNTTTDIINFKANSLLAGNYLLTIYAFDLSYPEEFYTLTKRLVVGASELMIRVNNPMYMELNWNEELRLDFVKNSYDPDETTGSTDLIAFDLLCVKDNDTDAQLAVLDTARNQSKFGNFDFSGIMELYFHGENLRIFSKGCFSFNSANLQPNPIKYLKGIVTVPALNISLDMTETRPILFEVLAHKDIRLAVSKQIKLSLNISSAFQIEPSSNLDDMSNKLNKVDELVSKNPTKALGLLKSFATAINDISSDSDDNHNVSTTTPANMEEQTSKLSNLRGKMLGTVDKIIGLVSDQSSLLSACETTSSVTSNPGQMPLGNQESGSRVMESMGEKMKDFKSDDEEGIKNIAESMLGTTGNVFSAASGSVPVVSKNFSEIDLLADENDVITEPPPIAAKITAPLIFYEMDTENFPEDLYEQELEEERIKKENDDALRKKTAKLAARTFNGISNAGGAISSNSNSSGNATKIESKGMALLVQKQKFNQSENSTNDQFRTESGPSIVMPALNKLISCKDGSAPSVSTKMFVSATNPFQSSDSNTQINGAIVSMELADDNGNPIPVHNTSEPFVIKVPAQEPARSYHAEIGLTQTNYYKTVLLTNISSLHVVLMPENEGDLYHVYIKFSANPKTDDSKYPDEKNYDFSFSLPKNKTNQEDLSELRYTAFIASNETKGNGTYYIAVKLYKLSHASIEYKKSLNDTEKTNKELRVNFTMRLFSTSCKYWSAESQAWLTDGCYVSGDTTYDTTVCHCYHLTTFGSDFYVPPNTIDFGSVFGKFANLNENSAVFATVLSIFGVYILIAIYSRYKDKKDLIKWGVTPLSDNLPTDNFYYVVQVQTGFGKECGTTSKVGMVLAGEQADSGVRKLTDDKRKAFKSGSICNFLLSTEESLGPLLYLRIWHDNSGRGSKKSWHLNMVKVVDLQTGEKSDFVCNNWLAVEKGDGLTDRVLGIACNNDVTQFKHLFTQSVKKKFTDNHLWFSVFSRPTKSNFTRLQRISCCMSVLFCTMIANAMFYKAEPSSVQPLFKLGSLKFTMAQVFTSIVSTLIVVPVNIIVVTLFRKSKLKPKKIQPTRSSHVAKQQYWRQNIKNVDLDKKNPVDRIGGDDFEAHKTTKSLSIGKKLANLKKKIFGINNVNEYRREQEDEKMNKKAGRNLPHWFVWIAWALCFISMIVPAFFVILYSMQWGKDRSNAWLSTMAMSFFQSLLIMDPLKVFIITAIITFVLRKPDDESGSIIDADDPVYTAILNHDEEFLHKSMNSLTDVEMREIRKARKAVLAKLEPVSPIDLELQRINRLNRLKINQVLKEGLSYLAFLIVVLFLAQQIKSPDSNKVHSDLSKIFLTNSPIEFGGIQSRDDFWLYVEKVLIENLYSPNWYNNKTQTWREKLTIYNRNAIRVGAARIRQLRVKEDTCRVHPRVKNIFKHCRAPYNFVDDDTKDYDIGWIEVNETAPLTTTTTVRPGKKPSKYKCQSAWCYQNTIQTKSLPIAGGITTYKGGGYVVTLGRTRDKSLALIDELKNNNWVDHLTRAVFFEFTVFNPNVNLFSSFNLIVEFLNVGSAVTYDTISIFSLYSYLGSFGIIVIIFQVVFVISIVYFIFHEIRQIKKHKCEYFKQFWNLNEIIIIVFSIVSMAMFGLRTVFTNIAIKDVHETEMAGFVNFNTLASWNEMYSSMCSIIIFCASLKFLRLLRFNRRVGMLAATLKYAAKDLFSFSFSFGVFFFAFTMFGQVVFGPYIKEYSNFMSSLATHFRFALGQYNFRGLVDSNLFIGAIYFVSFIFIVLMGLVSMFCAILCEAFEKVKEDMAKQKNEFEMLTMISKVIKKVTGKSEKRSKKISGKVADLNDSTKEQVSSLDITSLSVTVKEYTNSTPMNANNSLTSFTNINRK